MTRNIGFRILAGLVLLASVAGIAYFAFNAGEARGAVLNIQAPAASGQPVPYYAYGMPYMHPFGFFGFGCLGLLVPLFLLFMAFAAMRHMLWGPRHGWHPMHQMHHGQWDDKSAGGEFVPPVFAEWHRRAHSNPDNPEDSAAQK